MAKGSQARVRDITYHGHSKSYVQWCEEQGWFIPDMRKSGALDKVRDLKVMREKRAKGMRVMKARLAK